MMMIKSKFIEISNLLNCKYEVEDFTVEGSLGSKLPITIHNLQLEYKGVFINIKFEFGNSNVGEIKFKIRTENKLTEFEVGTTDNFWRLITFEKRIWKIKCQNINIENHLIKSLKSFGLTQMAEKTTFEPQITGKNELDFFVINTKFYLGFENKENSILTLINFHKSLIEYLQNQIN
jgi:hypothetical protein